MAGGEEGQLDAPHARAEVIRRGCRDLASLPKPMYATSPAPWPPLAVVPTQQQRGISQKQSFEWALISSDMSDP